MSQPTFPEIDKEMTRESALNMILTSIAMEELALSHIMNAEGEKLQYALKALDFCDKRNNSRGMNDILAVNQSITRLLETVSQSQMLLKSKMESVLDALPKEYHECHECCGYCECCNECPCRQCDNDEPPCPPFYYQDKCFASFRGLRHGEVWRKGDALSWICDSMQGQCIVRPPHDSTKIILSPGCYTVSFAVNIKSKQGCSHGIAISLRQMVANRKSDVFTCHYPSLEPDTMITASTGGIIIISPEDCGNTCLTLELSSPEYLTAESSMFSVVKI